MAQGVMRIFSLTRTERYGIAILSVVIAAALRLAFDPILGEIVPFLFFFLPVILAAWYGGLGPGLLATALSLLLGDYLFLPPRYSILRYDIPEDPVRSVLVGLYGTTVSLLAGRLRKSIKANITESKRAEEKARFLAGLNQGLLPLTDPEEVIAVAVRMLGEHLGADRCAYAEVEADKEDFVVRGDYTRGAGSGTEGSIMGRFSLADLDSEALRRMRENQPYVVNDIEAEALTGADLSIYRRLEIQAL
ncbi:MAG: DUF4118 domain-containing protein, partial [Blastocatellia bacterium]